MTLRHIRIFVAVCRAGSMTGAAKALYLSQPAVSQAVRELEEYYGVRLFDRIARRLDLTESGRQFLAYATPILSLLEELDQKAAAWDANLPIRVGSSMTIGTKLLPGLIAAFQSKWPGVPVRVTVGSSSRIAAEVEKNALDLGLVESPVSSPDLAAEAFGGDCLQAVCPPADPLSKRRAGFRELLDRPLLLRERGSGAREVFHSTAQKLGAAYEPAWESANTQALVEGVAAGLGVSVLPLPLVEEAVRAGRICPVTVPDLPVQRPYWMIHHKNKYLSQSMKNFLAFCAGWAK